MNEATTMLGPCQVRSNTESPCSRRAEVEILGVAFCGPCAHEQEVYFAIGELTQEQAESLRGKPLAAALERMRRERAGGTGATCAETHHALPSADETKRLALTNN